MLSVKSKHVFSIEYIMTGCVPRLFSYTLLWKYFPAFILMYVLYCFLVYLWSLMGLLDLLLLETTVKNCRCSLWLLLCCISKIFICFMISDKVKLDSSLDERKEGSKNGGSGRIAAHTFRFRELAAATKNFRADCLLGEGGFGRVYKGRLESTNQVSWVRMFSITESVEKSLTLWLLLYLYVSLVSVEILWPRHLLFPYSFLYYFFSLVDASLPPVLWSMPILVKSVHTLCIPSYEILHGSL